MGKVRNILHSKGPNNQIYSIVRGDTVLHALQVMAEKNVGALLITENEKLVGIFTERDYARKLFIKGKSSRDTLVDEVMTEKPITVNMQTGIEECMKIMSEKGRRFRHLPVVENDKLVGMISTGDVVRYIIDEQKLIIENLEQYITGHH
jgi:CBS domain-containing protein